MTGISASYKNHVKEAHRFYEKHGGKAIILARFIPIIRTFAPIVAGIADMTFSIFFIYNIVGALLWSVGLTLVGYYVGNLIPDKYFEPIILGVIFLSLLPAFFHMLNTKEKRARLYQLIKFSKKRILTDNNMYCMIRYIYEKVKTCTTI